MPHSTSYILHSTLKPPFYILHFTFYIIIAFVMMSCTSSTKPKTGSLSGRVILVNDTDDPSLDPGDFSGVTVALYELAVLDTTILRINQEYPQIGVQISQETEFDHRLQNPIKTVQSSADGTFLIDGITVGKYNLVIFKNGWSIKYSYQIDIADGSKTVTTCMQPIELYPLRVMPSVMHDDYVFRSNRTYIFDTDAHVLSDVLIEGSTLILIGSGKRVDFHGQVQKQQETTLSRVTAASSMYSINMQASIDYFLKINFSSTSNVDISGLIFSYSHDGLAFSSSGVSLQNVLIANTTNSLTILGNSTSIEALLMRDSSNRGIIVQGQLALSKSILYNNHDACFLSESDTEINNNYIIKNYIGVRPFYGTNVINNNCFDRNENAIAPCASAPSIFDNVFLQNNKDIELNGYYVQSSVDYCNPIVENNNFLGNGWYVHIMGRNSVYSDGSRVIPGVNQNQIYPNNYLLASDLQSHIYDANNPDSGPNVSHLVIFAPRRHSPVNNAGIQLW